MKENSKDIEIVPKKQKHIRIAIILTIIILFVISLINLDLAVNFTVEYFLKALNVIYRMLHFDLSNWKEVLLAAFESISVAALSTILSAIAAFFVSFFAATNISNNIISKIIKGIAAWIRAVPTTIWTLIFVAYLGLGAFPGVLGLSLHSFAYLVKAFSQSIEEVRIESIDAIRATGASWIMVISKAIVPSTITALISWVALRFEINVAQSSILGFVGAGGIGQQVSSTMKGYKFEQAGFVVLVIFLMSFSIEMLFHK